MFCQDRMRKGVRCSLSRLLAGSRLGLEPHGFLCGGEKMGSATFFCRGGYYPPCL